MNLEDLFVLLDTAGKQFPPLPSGERVIPVEWAKAIVRETLLMHPNSRFHAPTIRELQDLLALPAFTQKKVQ